FNSLPQIISAFDPQTAKRARQLFSVLTDTIIELAPLEAELAKLYCNAWRYITFAAANQFYMLAELQGVDFYKIHRAITTNYPRLRDFPKAGFAAGPCLFKDTMQLLACSNNNFTIGWGAMLVNEGLPNFLVERIKKAVNIRNTSVGILGMAFKGNSDDKRESLAYKLRKILAIEAKAVYCTDVYIQDSQFVSLEECIEKSDVLILGAPHTEYQSLSIPPQKQVIDIWHFINQ
ncbi:MAG TPA: UDP binding domain-containing protein, partial [Patescibacteria group bacterium]|nr:UDP binding domain-containing protein [Patescibacteria group bacterium]